MIIKIALTAAIFITIFGIVKLIDWLAASRKCNFCGKRFNKKYVTYQYNCGGYECKCQIK